MLDAALANNALYTVRHRNVEWVFDDGDELGKWRLQYRQGSRVATFLGRLCTARWSQCDVDKSHSEFDTTLSANP